MVIDKSKSIEMISIKQFKDMQSRVDKYIKDGGLPTPNRRIYINYETQDSFVTYSQYLNILERYKWDTSVKNIPLYVPPENISGDDKILPISTFLDMESRVNRYINQGGIIADNRAIFLKMSELKEYITYVKYKELLKRVEAFRLKNNRDPNFVYLKVLTNTNESRPEAVSDDITPNKDGWYFPYRFKKDSASIRQETNYWCADNSIQLLWYELTGNWYSESYIAKIAGTSKNGTGHDGINAALKVLAKRDGININIEWKYLSDLGYDKLGKLVKDPTVGTFQHVVYKYKWGHYEAIAGVNPKTKKILICNSLSGGWLEYRSFSINTGYANACSQKSICVVTKK